MLLIRCSKYSIASAPWLFFSFPHKMYTYNSSFCLFYLTDQEEGSDQYWNKKQNCEVHWGACKVQDVLQNRQSSLPKGAFCICESESRDWHYIRVLVCQIHPPQMYGLLYLCSFDIGRHVMNSLWDLSPGLNNSVTINHATSERATAKCKCHLVMSYSLLGGKWMVLGSWMHST